jgi:Ca2+/Na+ antiporter
VAGFEPTTSCSQSRRDTGLRYTPRCKFQQIILQFFNCILRLLSGAITGGVYPDKSLISSGTTPRGVNSKYQWDYSALPRDPYFGISKVLAGLSLCSFNSSIPEAKASFTSCLVGIALSRFPERFGLCGLCGERGIRTPGTVSSTAV